MEPELPSDSEDSRILQAARELCRQLNLENLSSEKVSWRDQYSTQGRWAKDKQGNPIGRYVTPHFPLFFQRTLVLRPVMQGRLTSEEWKPLLASSLIFYGQLRSQVTRRSALVFAPMLVLIAALLPGLLIRNSIFSDPVVFTLTALVIATAVGGVYSSLLLSRKFMLLADRKGRGAIRIPGILESSTKDSVIRTIRRTRGQDVRMGMDRIRRCPKHRKEN